jgi:hypothetical protein
MAASHVSGPWYVGGVPTQGMGGTPLFTGKWYFVDPANGSNGNSGAADSPWASVYYAFSRCTSGNNDVIVLVGNGGTSATQRLSLANAQAVDSSVTAGTLVWNKNATHLIGEAAPGFNARARFAPPTGTYTQSTFGSGNFVTVSGTGCYFSNISLFNGFSTGGNSQICWTDTGNRNVYNNVMFGGAGDAASAQSTSSRSLLISGSGGEHTFNNCEFGLDTVTKTVANATLEFAGATPRNTFNNCNFSFQTSAATPIGILGSGTGNIDRWQKFDRCTFINNVQSTSTTMSGLATLAASSGGLLLMKDCTLVGITEFGTDATTRGQIYVDGGTVTAATSGIAVNPT